MMCLRWRFITVLIVTLAGCTDDGFVGEAKIHTTSQDVASNDDATLRLERARQLLEARTAPSVGRIALNGYNFHREVDVGQGVRVIVISRNLGGGLLVFVANGANVATEETNEITSLQIFDLDEDGVAEIATEEIEGRGTGILEKRFHIYRIMPKHIETLWVGESYSRHARTPEKIEETTGFLRFDGSGAGRKARITHLVLDAAGRPRETTLEWRDGRLRPID